jgi:hypothetical protein
MPTNPVYQSSGILYSDMPKVQPYALNESIKASQSLQSSLDRISDFAFKGAEKEAERKGLQWGIDNPVSTEQIAEAVKMGINPGTLLPASGTTFADAARKVLAKTSRADLELKARNEIINIRLLSEIGSDIDMDTADAKLRGIIDGYSKVIGSLDPEEGASARASISSYAVDARKQIGEQLVKLNQVENKAIVDEALSTYSDEALRKLEFMDIKDPQKFSEELSPTKLAIINKARQTGAENYNKVIETIRTKDQEVINTAIANHIATQSDFTKAVLDLDKGIAGDFTAFLKMENKDKIIKMATEAASSKHNLIEQNQKLQRTVNEESYRDITTRFGNGSISGDQAVEELKAKKIHISDDEFKAIKFGQDDTPGNMRNFNMMYNRAQTDSLSISEIDRATQSNMITFKQGFKLKETYFGRTDDDKSASKTIMSGVGVASGETLIRQPDKIILVAKANQIYGQRRDAARAKGEPFNVTAEARNAIAEVVGSSKTPEYEEAQQTLKDFAKTWNFTYSEDSYTANDVEKMWPDKDKAEKKLLKKALKDIEKYKASQKAAAGIRD